MHGTLFTSSIDWYRTFVYLCEHYFMTTLTLLVIYLIFFFTSFVFLRDCLGRHATFCNSDLNFTRICHEIDTNLQNKKIKKKYDDNNK